MFYFKPFLASWHRFFFFFLSQINLYWKEIFLCFSSGDTGYQFERSMVVLTSGRVGHTRSAPHCFLSRLCWTSCENKIPRPSQAIDSCGQLEKWQFCCCTRALQTISGSLGQSLSLLQAPCWGAGRLMEEQGVSPKGAWCGRHTSHLWGFAMATVALCASVSH